MSIETGLAIGGKLLAPHAGKVSVRLAKKMTYRWRVERSVNRRLDIEYSRRHFRAWLKTVSQEDLAEPIEVGGSALAIKLDKWLSVHDTEWIERVDRLSQSLRLVEALYLAILKEADPSIERQLNEQWARQRNTSLIAMVVDLAGGTAPIDSSDRAAWLYERSLERRRIRLDAFELDLAIVEKELATLNRLIPVVAPGEFKILVGPFGAGKSEIAEEWHRTTIAQLRRGENAAIPVWLHAREIGSEGLEVTIRQHVSSTPLHRQGVAVVIDGLDEVDGASAEIIAHDARVFLAGNHKSFILATCRPHVLPANPKYVHVEGLAEEDARNLVERLGDARQATWQWTPELVETIRRPFFALAAASLLALNQAPSGQAELIAKLVEQALQRANSKNAIGSREVYDVLVKLGVNMTRSNGRSDDLTFYERNITLSTRLVGRVPQGGVAFALPVFEQWFAAQSLQSDFDSVAEALASPSSFDRWRWALAVAVISSSPEKADDLLEATLRMNPGAGAWLIEQVSHRSHSAIKDQLEQNAPKRLLRATRTWVNAVGPLAPFMFPVAGPEDPIRLGIRIQGRRAALGWSLNRPVADEIVPLPDNVRFFAQSNPEWFLAWSGSVPGGDLWPWTQLRDDIARQTLELLEGMDILGPPGGLWHQEKRYRTARMITESRGVRHNPMNRIAIINAGETLLSRIEPGARAAKFLSGSRSVSSDEIRDLIYWLKDEPFDSLKRLVPVPDVEHPLGGWVWDFYSPEQMTRFCAETLGLACIAYEELVDTVFSKFGWTLGCNTCRPFGVVGTVAYSESAMGITPGLDYEQMPMELMEKELDRDSSLIVSSNGRAAVRLEQERDSTRDKRSYEASLKRWEKLTDWAAQHGIDSPFFRLDAASTVIECNHERPVSHQAAQWIWHDLQRLSLASGTFPQLAS